MHFWRNHVAQKGSKLVFLVQAVRCLTVVQADLESMSQQRSDSDAAGAELMGHLEEAETRTLAAEKAAQAASEEATAVKRRLEDLQVQNCQVHQAAVKSAVYIDLASQCFCGRKRCELLDTFVVIVTWHASFRLMSLMIQAFLRLKHESYAT